MNRLKISFLLFILPLIFAFIFFHRTAFAIQSDAIYYGVYPMGDSEDTKSTFLQRWERFENNAGKKASIVNASNDGNWWYTDQLWGDFNTLLNNGKDGDSHNNINEIRKRGTIPLILWGSYNPLRPDGTMIKSGEDKNSNGVDDCYEQIKKYSLKNITKGDFDTYIHAWARQIAAWGHPLMIRLNWEANSEVHININPSSCDPGNSWKAKLYDDNTGQYINTPEDYVAAWQHTVDIFRQEKASNVTWVWSTLAWASAGYGGTNTVSMSSIYPNDSYVDWIGFDLYNMYDASRPQWKSFSELMNSTTGGARPYDEIIAITSKPFMISELGTSEDFSNPSRKPQWIKDTFNDIANKKFPRIQAVFWWDMKRSSSFQTKWSSSLTIESSSQSIQEFKDAIGNPIFTANDYPDFVWWSAVPKASGLNYASFSNQKIGSNNLIAGRKYNISIAMKNTSSKIWTMSDLFSLGSYNPPDNLIWGLKRVKLEGSERIPPGQIKIFNFTITAPQKPGKYNFQWRMVKECPSFSCQWFGESTPNLIMNVSPFSVLPSVSITSTLAPGIKSNEVATVQQFLAKDKSIYPQGLITGYFGILTQEAIQRFQCKYNIVCSGTPKTTGYGTIGPRTRSLLNELMTNTANLEISGWIPYWRAATGTQEAILHINSLKEINPFGYTVKNDGTLFDAMNINDEPWTSLIKTAKAKKVRVIPTVMWSNGAAIHKILSNKKTRIDLEDEIANLVKKNKFDGIDIDFEGKYAETKDYFSTFLKGLYMRMGNKWVMCTIEARTPLDSRYDTIPKDIQYANDYVAINKYCDRVRIMTYDQGSIDLRLNEMQNGPYVPVSDPKWVEKVIQLASKTISKKKLIIGVATYGYEYEVTPLSEDGYRYDLLWAFNPKYALDLASQLNISPGRNAAGELSFTYSETTPLVSLSNISSSDATNTINTNNTLLATTTVSYTSGAPTASLPRILWWSDASAIKDKIALAKKLGVRGIAIFKIDGGADPELWKILE
ncbi:MAG: glycosyl hydrolase family 18 protein [Patescibacteria group bacterium]